MVNDQISIAMETKEHLTSQRHQFKRFQTRLNDMSNRFPLISRYVRSTEFQPNENAKISNSGFYVIYL